MLIRGFLSGQDLVDKWIGKSLERAYFPITNLPISLFAIAHILLEPRWLCYNTVIEQKFQAK